MHTPSNDGARPRARRKLIEVALPLEAINREAAREKSIRHGHPSTLHLWWARRPLAACRAVLFGQLVDDPSSWPERFGHDEARIAAERGRLHRLIERLVPWEASTDERVLDEARAEIARSVAWGRGEEPPGEPRAVLAYLQAHAPPVYDPFCGGGSIPLEAQRLGLRAYGSDLNPVAVLITKALVEIPPKFAGLPPVNPEARAKLAGAGAWQGRGAQGLAEDVRHYGRWMREEAQARIGHLYPRAALPGGGQATVIAWLWARTVPSPNPAAGGRRVPLAASFLLSAKEGRKAWVEPVLDAAAPDGWRFEVRTGVLTAEEEARAKVGTKAARGANFVCALSSTPITPDHVKAEGRAGRMGARLMAVVAEGRRGRVYLAPTPEQERAAAGAWPEWEPEGALPKNPRWFSPPDYGMPEYRHLFTPRQLATLATFSDLIHDARGRVLADARTAGLPSTVRLASGGAGAEAYADAVATYLGCAVDRATDYWSSIATWVAAGEFIRNTFARQAIPMTWDYAEPNPFSSASGNWDGTCLDWIERVLRDSVPAAPGVVFQHNAANGPPDLPDPLISTDPPYYDNIGYADLSDYFYTWARHSLGPVWPDLFRTMATPKAEELVASPYRHGGREAAQAFFQKGMRRAVGNMETVSRADLPLAIYYAFKQTEAGEAGVTSTGWATFLQSIIDTGLVVDATLPLRTERSARTIGIGTNALQYSIVHVCRCRGRDAPTATRAQFVRDLKRELPDGLRVLQTSNLQPADLGQVCAGLGMAVFSRYARVIEADDGGMSVRTALEVINRAADEILHDQDAAYDAPTRFSVSWFEQNGMGIADYAEAERMVVRQSISVQGVHNAGLVVSGGGKVRLTRRDELPEAFEPGPDTPVWAASQHLSRRRLGAGGSETRAAGLLARLNGQGEAARDLAYRLYGICERRKWAEEAYAYNALVASWPRLVDLARARPEGPAQHDLEL